MPPYFAVMAYSLAVIALCAVVWSLGAFIGIAEILWDKGRRLYWNLRR
jgi:hypothetical protein